ncbi:acyltransferase [Desulfocucumis palustris]|uniref:acyltransferase n=1 Tax=Desulfocucumis palustris TaxID=1898651 RepID=UPI000CE9E36C|nr:acyltransferase [Desulfocucumis palustris]
MKVKYLNLLKKYIEMVYYCYIERDRTAYARKLGVRVGRGGQILANPLKVFGTEPWLIKIGDHVDITAGVQFLSHDGGIWVARGLDPELNKYDSFKPITVGNNVMIGINSLIMPGITIGDNVIIGGYSVITKDVSSNSIVAGVPAKPISNLESYLERIQANLVPTKHMSQEQKRAYLQKKHPEWFE